MATDPLVTERPVAFGALLFLVFFGTMTAVQYAFDGALDPARAGVMAAAFAVASVAIAVFTERSG